MISIIQNEKKPFTIDIIRESSGKPFDLTGFVEVTVCFVAGPTTTILTESGGEITVVDAVLGIISGNLTQAQTDAMPVENAGLIEISVDFGGGDVKKSQIASGFSVRAKACP